MFADLLYFELALRCRRRQLLLYRWAYAAWVLLLFVFAFMPPVAEWWNPMARTGPALGGSFITVMLWQRWFLVILATPLFVAGQITEEKQRGVLQFVFLTELESRQIVSAKLLAQSALLATVLLLDVPMLILGSGLEDYTLAAVAAHTFCLVVLIFALGAFSLLAAVWCRTTRGVLVVVYGVVGLAILGAWVLDFVLAVLGGAWSESAVAGLLEWVRGALETVRTCVDPLWVIGDPARPPPQGVLALRLFAFAAIWGSAAAAMTALAIRWLRPVYLSQIGEPKTVGPALERPEVGDDPLAWKTQYVDGILPGYTVRRVPRWLVLGTIVVLTMTAEIAEQQFAWAIPFRLHALAAAGVLGMLITVRVCTAVPLEHQQNTFDSLLLTGRHTVEVIDSMYHGVFRAFRPVLLAYTAGALAGAVLGGTAAIHAVGATVGLVWVVVWIMALVGFAYSGLDAKVLRNIAGTLMCAWGILYGIGYGHFMCALSGSIMARGGPGGPPPDPWVGVPLEWLSTLAVPVGCWVIAGWFRRQLLGYTKGVRAATVSIHRVERLNRDCR
jgi:hypothetical protein